MSNKASAVNFTDKKITKAQKELIDTLIKSRNVSVFHANAIIRILTNCSYKVDPTDPVVVDKKIMWNGEDTDHETK